MSSCRGDHHCCRQTQVRLRRLTDMVFLLFGEVICRLSSVMAANKLQTFREECDIYTTPSRCWPAVREMAACRSCRWEGGPNAERRRLMAAPPTGIPKELSPSLR